MVLFNGMLQCDVDVVFGSGFYVSLADRLHPSHSDQTFCSGTEHGLSVRLARTSARMNLLIADSALP